MSNNPFGDKRPFEERPDANPYSAPSAQADANNNAGNPVIIPGIFLLVLSTVFMLLLLASIPAQIIRLSEIDASTPKGFGEFTGGIVALGMWLIMTAALTYGSICMIRMKGYAGAVTAAIVATIPCCSPFILLGIPFGIWALVVLSKPYARTRFK